MAILAVWFGFFSSLMLLFGLEQMKNICEKNILCRVSLLIPLYSPLLPTRPTVAMPPSECTTLRQCSVKSRLLGSAR